MSVDDQIIFVRTDTVPKYRKPNETGKLLQLTNDYIFSFHHFDGFTTELLSIDFLFDTSFQAHIYFDAFRLGNAIQKEENGYLVRTTLSDLPNELYPFLEKILFGDVLNLKDVYDFEGLSIDDGPSQQYLFNHTSGTKTVYINGLLSLTSESFITPVEQDFLHFHLLIKRWTADLSRLYSRLDFNILQRSNKKTA